MRRLVLCIPAALCLCALAAAVPAIAQGMDDVQISATEVAGGVYMLTGRGGNLGLSVGEDFAFLVDDQFAPLTEKILAAVTKITDRPLRFVLNTHWHGDHTGGNENLGKAGVLIVAHDNVRARLSTEQFMAAFDRTVPPSPAKALPVVTFTDTVRFHVNGDTLHALHVPAAHTDGDSIVHIETADVIHMGDVFFNGMYPFVDLGSGGSVDGVIAAVERALALAGDGTKIIPGHGPLTDRAGLAAYRDMLKTIRERVAKLVAEGKTREEAVAAKPTADYDEKLGGGFIGPDVFAGTVYDSLKK